MDKLRDFWVRAALVVSLLLPFYFAVAALGSKVRLLDWRFAFVTMARDWGAICIVGALGFAVVGLVLALFVPPWRGRRIALVGVIIPALALGYAYYRETSSAAASPIHDVSTDLIDPPQFSPAVAEARSHLDHANGLDLLGKHTPDGRAFIDLQRRDYADIDSIPTGLAPGQAFDMALALARQQSWRINIADPQNGRIEATSETLWFGLIDDIAVRVRPDGSGARIDMRSVSRVGDSDGGVNARRMRAYLGELRRRLAEAES